MKVPSRFSHSLADRVRNNHKSRQILVGVEGPTGAGKSSFLGSLLKIPEIFPSGQESAATAVMGKASWNWVDTPGYEFRATVFFRSRSEIADELESLLKEIKRWSGLVAGQADVEDDDGDRADTISIARNAIEHQLPRVQAVWDMEEEKLLELAKKCPQEQNYQKAIRTIFCRNPMATKFLLDGKAEFNASEAEELSKAIKPFLDSSPSTHGGGSQFSAWTLVRSVHIYAKAVILKTGITLVDLPGCGDAVESRSEVAQKVSHTLDVRMVVSPIIRATDEKQGQALMQNGFDEAQMRIRGKLDGRGFCVIASKMDDMKVDSYIRGCQELADDPEILQKQSRLEDLKDEKIQFDAKHKELKSAKKKAESRKKKASKSYEKAMEKHAVKLQSKSSSPDALHANKSTTENPGESDAHLQALRAERDTQAQAAVDAEQSFDQCELRQAQIDIELTYTRDWIHHRAYQTRNARVINRLRTDFARRQSRLDHGKSSEEPQADNEYVLPIFPVSTKAFWRLGSKDPPMAGFPNKVHTGVPAVEKWLHQATLSKRKKHLNETLDGYQNLMTMMRIYSATSGQDGDFNFTRSEVEAVLAETHAFYTQASSVHAH